MWLHADELKYCVIRGRQSHMEWQGYMLCPACRTRCQFVKGERQYCQIRYWKFQSQGFDLISFEGPASRIQNLFQPPTSLWCIIISASLSVLTKSFMMLAYDGKLAVLSVWDVLSSFGQNPSKPLLSTSDGTLYVWMVKITATLIDRPFYALLRDIAENQEIWSTEIILAYSISWVHTIFLTSVESVLRDAL